MRKELSVLLVLLLCFSVATLFINVSEADGDDYYGPQQWDKQGIVLTPEDWETHYLVEPTVIEMDNGTVQMWYRGGGVSPYPMGIGYAYSNDGGLTFTKDAGNPQIGGVAGDQPQGPHVMENGTSNYLLYVAEGYGWWGAHRYINVYTSDDYGGTWTSLANDTLAEQSWFNTGSMANPRVWKEDDTHWYMIYTAYHTAASAWASGLATSSDGITWSQYSSNPLIISSGSGVAHKSSNDLYGLWHHSDMPSTIEFSTSTDLHTWTEQDNSPVLERDYLWEGNESAQGQVADACLLTINGNVHIFYDALENQTTALSYIAMANTTLTFDEMIDGIDVFYNFYGPFDEETGYQLDENVTVNAYYSTESTPFETFDFNGSDVYVPGTNVLFFEFVFADNSTREYWIDPSEDVEDIYVFWGATTNYIIGFLDTTGILDDYPYVTAKRYVNGTLFTVEKRKVDVYDTILMNLIAGRTYSIYLGNEDTTYVFGDLTMTSTTTVQLTLRGVDFPKETLLLQKYVRCYAYRNSSIFVVYADTSESTTSVLVEINYADFNLAYNATLTSQSFSLEWPSADDGTSYQVTATVTHETYGTLTFKTYLPADTSKDAPFSLEWLGQWQFDSSVLIPSIIILCVAGCFSALNAEVGAVLMCIVAIILTLIGWIPINAGSLVAAISFAILMALVYHKRRGGISY